MKRLVCLVLFLAWAGSAGAASVQIQQVGVYALPAGATGATGLSGITHVSGDGYYAISDTGAKLHPLSITLNTATGAIASAALDNAITLAAGSDLEGVAYDHATGRIYASDEVGPAVREHALPGGGLTTTLPVPAVFADVRANRGFESLSLRTGGVTLWTANEEALVGDGPVSTVGAGTTVRLLKFSSQTPDGQWAYLTDGITGDIPLTDVERSGVSDLLALPNGTLLVLERELGWMTSPFGPQFRHRIYEVDFTGATDVSSVDNLDGAVYTAVSKELLWEGIFGTTNYEGMTLGPVLDDGSRSLLLISDDQGGQLNQDLLALKISGEGIPEPATLSLLVLGAGALAASRRRRKR